MNVNEWVKERHEYWWNYLLERVWVPEDFPKKIPPFELTFKPSRTAGTANIERCTYNLNYVISEQGKFDETICHEVCHTFSKRLVGWASHGALWKYLYNVVCGSVRGQYHSYTVIKTKATQPEEIKLLVKYLKLQRKMTACTRSSKD